MESDSDSKEAGVAEIVPAEKNSEPVSSGEPPIVLPTRKQTRTDYSNAFHEHDPEVAATVTRLAKLGLSKTAVALGAGITPLHLNKWYLDEYLAGQASMQEIVALGLLEQAKAGNPQVLMYLGKSKLGWTESNVVEHVGEVRAVVSAKPMSKEEFEARYIRKELPEDDDEL